jgi:hypothetical protein
VVQAPLQLRVAAPAGQPGEALLGLGHVPAARAERAVERVVEHQQERQEAEQDRGRSPDADGRGGEQGGEGEGPQPHRPGARSGGGVVEAEHLGAPRG